MVLAAQGTGRPHLKGGRFLAKVEIIVSLKSPWNLQSDWTRNACLVRFLVSQLCIFLEYAPHGIFEGMSINSHIPSE